MTRVAALREPATMAAVVVVGMVVAAWEDVAVGMVVAVRSQSHNLRSREHTRDSVDIMRALPTIGTQSSVQERISLRGRVPRV